MHFDLKPISVESIPEALAKVERYRLLNEPSLAESICLDILTVAPDHQQALISLLLARTDQFGSGMTVAKAREVLSQIKGDYERAYYAGIISERNGARPSSPRRAWQRFGRLSRTAGGHGALRARRSPAPARQ